ncbi:MAG: putative porin [Candidatus Omnitrophica bacterium]|nr:putative porin [Candidatus Omnitrophota bacterium]
MKKLLLVLCLVALFASAHGRQAQASEVDVLVQKLVEKSVLSPAEAQIIMDETKLQVSKDLAQAKSLSVPDWTQRVKWGGDVRFRTQGDWGKPTTSDSASTIKHQRIRERVRGRFYMEGKINDFMYGGVRFAGGATSARSTNDTLDDYFAKDYAMFDQYYIRVDAPSEMIRDYGQYFSDARLWLGRFTNPYESSELVWDTDINLNGIAFQYVSPDLKIGTLPDVNIFSNLGFHWLNESANISADPLLFGGQAGIKTARFGPLDTIMQIATSMWDFTHLKGKNPTGSSGTNSRWWNGAGGDNTAGTYRYDYYLLDLLLSVDNEKIFDIPLPNGLYTDFVHNMGCSEQNNGFLLGCYIGKKKLKAQGDWKVRTEWRYIERDAVADFTPDSDFYGFGTYTASSTSANTNGVPAEGGTNGKGINIAFEYQLLKNTGLNIEYYWMEPIKSWGKLDPWNEVQFDIVTKF